MIGRDKNSTRCFLEIKKFVKGRGVIWTFCGIKNGRWLGGIENSTK